MATSRNNKIFSHSPKAQFIKYVAVLDSISVYYQATRYQLLKICGIIVLDNTFYRIQSGLKSLQSFRRGSKYRS